MKTSKLILVAVTALAAQAAIAHTELSESAPANHAMLEAAPQQVTLHFSEPVRLTALTVQKAGESKQSLGPLPGDNSERFTVPAPMLNDGHYTVSWRALSEDTHVMSGEFEFMVGAAGEHGQADHAAGHSEQGHGDHADHHSAAMPTDHAHTAH